jgi:branched-chain amino acid transport system substrate-binding protein
MLKKVSWLSLITGVTVGVLASTTLIPTVANAADPVPVVTASDIATIQKIFGPGGKAAGKGLTIPIGTLLALTGAGAQVGTDMLKGQLLAAAQIKAAGGPDFQILAADHQNGTPSAGVTEAQRLITQSKIPVMLSSYGGVTAAIAPLIADNKVLTFNGGGPDVTQANKPYLWLPANYYADVSAPGNLAYLQKLNPKAKRLMIIGSMENGVNAMKVLVPKYWKQMGGTVVGTEINTVGQTDFSQMIARVRVAKPDVIWTDTFGDDMGYLMKALVQGGIKAPVVGQELSQNACKIAGTAYNKYLFSGSFFDSNLPINPWATLLAKSYKASYNENAEYYGATYYEDVFLVWDLVKKVIAAGGNPASGEELQAALVKDPTFKTVLGGTTTTVATMSLNTKDHSGARPMGIYKVSNCTATRVATINAIKPGQKPAATLEK